MSMGGKSRERGAASQGLEGAEAPGGAGPGAPEAAAARAASAARTNEFRSGTGLKGIFMTNPNAAKELEDQEFARKQAEKKKQEAAAAAEKTRAETEQKRDMCATARGQLAMLLDARQPVFRFNDKGERVAFDDQMRRDEIERTQRLIRDSCRN